MGRAPSRETVAKREARALRQAFQGAPKADLVRAAFQAFRASDSAREAWGHALDAAHQVAHGRPVGLRPEGGWVSGVGCDRLPEAAKEALRTLSGAGQALRNRAYALLALAFPRSALALAPIVGMEATGMASFEARAIKAAARATQRQAAQA